MIRREAKEVPVRMLKIVLSDEWTGTLQKNIDIKLIVKGMKDLQNQLNDVYEHIRPSGYQMS